MINFQDFRRFRFWSRERGRGPMTSYLYLHITRKYSAIKWVVTRMDTPKSGIRSETGTE